MTHLSCCSLSLLASATSSLALSTCLSLNLLSKLLKIQVKLLNNLPMKSFGSSHQNVPYELQNHIPPPPVHLIPSSYCLPPLFSVICFCFPKMSRNCMCKTFIHCASILKMELLFMSIRRWNMYTHYLGLPHHQLKVKQKFQHELELEHEIWQC